MLFPVVRPYADETTAAGLESFASPAWLVSHLSGAAALILLPLGLLALGRDVLARAAFVTTWLGSALSLPYYGAETFALSAIGRRADDAPEAALELVDAVRTGGVQLVTFGTGLVLLAVGGVLAALAVRRSTTLPRWSGAPLAAGLVLFLPQFYAAPALRMMHGVLLGGGCLVLSLALRTAHHDGDTARGDLGQASLR